MWLLAGCARVETATGALPDEAYVWQRVWTDAVREAVAARGPGFGRLHVLAAELERDPQADPEVERGLTLTEIAHGAPPGSGLVFRCGQLPNPAERLTARLVPIIARALAARPDTPEVQLDVDAPTRRLREYAAVVRALRATLPPEVALTVTAAPAWLDDPGMAELAAAADGFVLQLHWLHRERGEIVLLDPDAAAHVEAAARLGRPFRAALPAHGYRVAVDGAAIHVAAETSAADPGTIEVRPDAAAVAALVRGWSVRHPAELQGIVWFRLPTDQDELAWAWPTLEAVRRGVVPRGVARVALADDGGAWTVTVHNDGDGDLVLPALAAPDAVLADGAGGYRWADGRLVPAEGGTLRPGQARIVGWVRPAGPGAPSVSVSAVSERTTAPAPRPTSR